jgi:hypothetical protein
MNSQQVQDIRLMYEAVYNEKLREKANEYNSIEELDEDLQQKVGKALDAASNFMKTNPVGKVVGAALAPAGPGRRTPTATSKDYRPVKEDIDLFDYLLEYLVAEGYADTNQDALVIMANMNKEQIEEATRLYYKLQRKGKGGSSAATAQQRSDADLKTQKNEKMEKQRQRQMREREPDDDDPRQHGSLSAAERNPSMR